MCCNWRRRIDGRRVPLQAATHGTIPAHPSSCFGHNYAVIGGLAENPKVKRTKAGTGSVKNQGMS
jgi:hypothetical protein